VFLITASGEGQTSSSSNISADVTAGFVTEVTGQAFNEATGTGYFNSFELDNDFAYRGGIYMNGQLAPMEGCVISNCDAGETVYGTLMTGAGPLEASEAYFGTYQARVIGNRCFDSTATHIGGGHKIQATIANNVIGWTTSSGIRCDAGSHRCVVTGNVIDTDNVSDANGGVSVFDSDFVSVSGNYIRSAISGITYNSSDFGSVTGNVIENCSVGIGFLQMDSGTISGNTVVNTYSDGIRVTGGTQNTVTGNAVFGAGTPSNNGTALGIEIVSSAGTSVTGNQVRNCVGGGIMVNGTNHVMVTSNVCRDNGSTVHNKPGIILTGTSNNCVVSANRCFDSRDTADRTQTYGVELGALVDSSIVSNNRLANNKTADISAVPAGCLIAHNGDATVEYNNTDVSSSASGGTTSFVDNNFQVQKGSGTIINRVVAKGGAGGTSTAPSLAVEGDTADIDFRIIPKGAGRLRYGTHVATSDVAISGYIEIKDSAGTVRRLAVIS
jgi:parallel beta-helix repeat protein